MFGSLRFPAHHGGAGHEEGAEDLAEDEERIPVAQNSLHRTNLLLLPQDDCRGEDLPYEKPGSSLGKGSMPQSSDSGKARTADAAPRRRGPFLQSRSITLP